MIIFSWVMTGLMALTMMGFGYLLSHKPPKDMNSLWGYRTSRSMNSEEAWEFAQRYAGHVWMKSGGVLAIVSLIVTLLLKETKYEDVMVFMLIYGQLGILVMVIPMTERAMRKIFKQESIRKN